MGQIWNKYGMGMEHMEWARGSDGVEEMLQACEEASEIWGCG